MSPGLAAEWRCHLEQWQEGLAEAAVQFVHGRSTETSTNNHSSAGLQHLHHKPFTSKLHLAEWAAFLVGKRPLQTQITSADGPSSPLWKRHFVPAGDAQQTRGVWDDARCVSGQGTTVVLDGAARQPSRAQRFPGYSHRMPQNSTPKKRFQYILHLILSSAIWASIRNNSHETNLKLMRTETRVEFSLCLVFCQLLPSAGAYFSLWGCKPEVDFIHQHCWALSLSLRAPVWLCSHGPTTPAHCTKVLSARGHLERDNLNLEMYDLSWGAPRNRCHLTPSR